jgi:hypothetical protein
MFLQCLEKIPGRTSDEQISWHGDQRRAMLRGPFNVLGIDGAAAFYFAPSPAVGHQTGGSPAAFQRTIDFLVGAQALGFTVTYALNDRQYVAIAAGGGSNS